MGRIEALVPAVVYVPPGRYLLSDTPVLFMYTHLIGTIAARRRLCEALKPRLHISVWRNEAVPRRDDWLQYVYSGT